MKKIRIDIDVDSGSEEIDDFVTQHIGATVMGTLVLLNEITPDILTKLDYDPYVRNDDSETET